MSGHHHKDPQGSLLTSARTGDLDDVIKRVSAGEDPNATGPQHDLTPLHLASLHGNLPVVEFLLDNGADVDPVDKWQCTPLHNAAGAGHVDVVKELCENGAKLDARTAAGKSPMDIARDKGKFEVLPVLQPYVNKNGKGGARGASSVPAGGKGNKYGVPGGRDPDYNNGGNRWAAGGGNGGKKGPKSVVLRRQPGDKNGGGRNKSVMYLPGQILDDDDDDDYDQRKTKMFHGHKKQLNRQLKDLERQEQLHRLNGEHARTSNQMQLAKLKYDRDLDDMVKQMQRIQESINGMSGQRDSELNNMERRLHDLQDNMYELDRTSGRRQGGNSDGREDDEDDEEDQEDAEDTADQSYYRGANKYGVPGGRDDSTMGRGGNRYGRDDDSTAGRGSNNKYGVPGGRGDDDSGGGGGGGRGGANRYGMPGGSDYGDSGSQYGGRRSRY